VSAGAAALLALLTLGFNLALRASLDHDANRVLAGRATASLGGVHLHGGRIATVEAPDAAALDVRVWVFAGRRAIERPHAPRPLQLAAKHAAGGPRGYANVPAADARLYSVPVTAADRPAGTLVSAISLEPYEKSASRALIASLIFAAFILVAIVAATRWTVSRALRPVAEMTADATSWSERDLDHRFNAGEPHDELTRLAAAFDSMLARLAASLRREKRFSGEVSHELRTPLAAIVAESDLALGRDRSSAEYRQALHTIAERSRQLQRILDTLVIAARHQAEPRRGTADAEDVIVGAAASCEPLASESGLELRVAPPQAPLRVAVDGDLAERVIAPLVENACRYGAGEVEVSARADGDSVEFAVADEGPGVPEDKREQIFEPGWRGVAGEATARSGGLGLALARRLAHTAGGEVEYRNANGRGALFIARLPRA